MAGKHFSPIFFVAFLTSIFIFNNVEKTSSSNILFFHSFATSSHRTAIWPLAEALANRGHNITYIMPLTQNRMGSHPRISELIPSKMIPLLENLILDVDINIRVDNRQLKWFLDVARIRLKLCEAFYTSPEIIEWLDQPNLHFDLIMIDATLGECAYGIVHKFQAKMIQFIQLLLPFMFDGLGLVPESSSIPDFLYHPRPDDMTLFNRAVSTVLPLFFRFEYLDYLEKLRPVISKGINSTDLPHLQEIEANTSLVMVNNYLFEDYPRALPPTFVSYSGLWCSKEKIKERKPLPLNIEKFVERSKGFFYISFGSAISASTMPVRMRNHFFNAFRRMPDYSFLLRWTGAISKDTPENAMLLPWFPQRDILAHHKIKGFMMQGGQPSTQEAICHAVPLIVVPICNDQEYIATRLEQIGAALFLDMDKIDENFLVEYFTELLHNKTYNKRLQTLSEQFIDRPLDPLENVIFWTEYVLRRDTFLLRPLSIKQSWWQRRLLDVYVFLLLIFLIVLLTCFIIFKIIVAFIYGKVIQNWNAKTN